MTTQEPGRCPACFAPKAEAAVCPSCGYDPAAPAAQETLAPGTVLSDRYVIGGLLGRGGFGATYRGYDSRLASMVAIKEYFLKDGVKRRPNGATLVVAPEKHDFFDFGRAKFLDEARLLAQLRPISRVVSVFDFFEANGTAYIIMDYICGLTIRQLQKRRADMRVSPERALPVFFDLLMALSDIHKEKVLHCDVSPDNIFVCGNGAIKLIDFGAARHATMLKAENHGVFLKPGYAPPEQYLEDATYNGPWTDIYAAGATIYHTLTGTLPPDSPGRLQDKVLRPLSFFGVELHPLVDSAIMRALSLRIEGRWRRAEDFADQLAEAGIRSFTESNILSQRLTGSISQQPAAPSTREIVTAEELATSLAAHGRYMAQKRDGKRMNLSRRDLSCLRLGAVNVSGADLSGAAFSCSDLIGANFSNANLYCADFSGANLRYAKFDNCDLRGAKFDNADLTGSSLEGADCREGQLFVHQGQADMAAAGATRDTDSTGGKGGNDKGAVSFATVNLSGAVLRNANLEAARFTQALLNKTDLSNANLNGASLQGARVMDATFTGANLAGCDFAGATLIGVDTNTPEFQSARIVRTVEQIARDLQIQIVEHRRWVDSLSHAGRRLVLKGGDIAGLQMAGVNWAAAEFEGVNLTDIVLDHAALSHTRFMRCALTRANLSHIDARGAQFHACDLAGIDLSAANLSPILLPGGKKLPALFRHSRLPAANLTGAKCEGADFRDADLTRTDFTGADLRGADFTGAVVAEANFTGAILAGATGLAAAAVLSDDDEPTTAMLA